jgi:hypothetical protein
MGKITEKEVHVLFEGTIPQFYRRNWRKQRKPPKKSWLSVRESIWVPPKYRIYYQYTNLIILVHKRTPTTFLVIKKRGDRET